MKKSSRTHSSIVGCQTWATGLLTCIECSRVRNITSDRTYRIVTTVHMSFTLFFICLISFLPNLHRSLWKARLPSTAAPPRGDRSRPPAPGTPPWAAATHETRSRSIGLLGGVRLPRHHHPRHRTGFRGRLWWRRGGRRVGGS